MRKTLDPVKPIKTKGNLCEREADIRHDFAQQYKNSPIPDNEKLQNLGVYMNRQSLSRMLFFNELYQKILTVNGVVMEVGVRWGQNLSLFTSFRGIYEPFNYTRKILGFDTFSGFPSVHEKDGGAEIAQVGYYNVSEGYDAYLDKVLTYHEAESPLSHMKKYELIKGDASVTVPQYLKDHPETIIALAYIDVDLYEPTKNVLKAIQGHLTKGSIIGFDELNWPEYPGETLALKEVFGLSKYKIQRSTLSPSPSYIVYE